MNVTVGDPDGDALTVNWFVDSAPERTDNVPASPNPTVLTLRAETVGSHIVRVDARDSFGALAQCSTTVNVVDGVGPVVTVSSESAEATGPGGAIVNYTATAIDAVDGPRPVTCSQASGTMFPIGSTTVTCTATDLAGNLGTGSGIMTVVDTTRPSITVSDETVEATSPAGAVVNYTVTASDAGDATLTINCSHPSGKRLPHRRHRRDLHRDRRQREQRVRYRHHDRRRHHAAHHQRERRNRRGDEPRRRHGELHGDRQRRRRRHARHQLFPPLG